MSVSRSPSLMQSPTIDLPRTRSMKFPSPPKASLKLNRSSGVDRFAIGRPAADSPTTGSEHPGRSPITSTPPCLGSWRRYPWSASFLTYFPAWLRSWSPARFAIPSRVTGRPSPARDSARAASNTFNSVPSSAGRSSM